MYFCLWGGTDPLILNTEPLLVQVRCFKTCIEQGMRAAWLNLEIYYFLKASEQTLLLTLFLKIINTVRHFKRCLYVCWQVRNAACQSWFNSADAVNWQKSLAFMSYLHTEEIDYFLNGNKGFWAPGVSSFFDPHSYDKRSICQRNFKNLSLLTLS